MEKHNYHFVPQQRLLSASKMLGIWKGFLGLLPKA